MKKYNFSIVINNKRTVLRSETKLLPVFVITENAKKYDIRQLAEISRCVTPTLFEVTCKKAVGKYRVVIEEDFEKSGAVYRYKGRLTDGRFASDVFFVVKRERHILPFPKTYTAAMVNGFDNEKNACFASNCKSALDWEIALRTHINRYKRKTDSEFEFERTDIGGGTLISICVDKESAKKNGEKLMRMLKDFADSVNSESNGASAGEPYRGSDTDRANTVRYSIIINTEDETPINGICEILYRSTEVLLDGQSRH